MATVFYISKANKAIRKNSLLVWLGILFKGRIKLGTFGGCDYYAFMCSQHHLRADIEHGYHDGHYYHQCDYPGCEYRYLI